jgi:RNA-directed DNA polymerase
MAKGGSEFAIKRLEGGRSPVNTDVLWPDRELAESQVLRIQAKLHQWAIDDPDRRFDDLFNLVCDPAVLVVAWARVRGNRGKRAAGVDGLRPQSILSPEEGFLPRLRHDLKARLFAPLPVRERMISKPGSSKLRRLGIPTARDRTVQAALKLVLEPIFEADFKPCSYGFRPRRRAQDAIAEIHQFTSRSYEWVLEGDIEACFDMIDHPALMDRVRSRVGDKRVLAVVKAFLHAGVLGEDGTMRDSTTGTPQGGILSPLLANIALSVLDEHFAEACWADSSSTYQRTQRRRAGLANYRIVRYADDFVVLVAGTKAHTEALREDVAAVLAPMGLRLSEAKTKVCHIDEGFDFLGFRIQRRLKRGTTKRVVYTYPRRRRHSPPSSGGSARSPSGHHIRPLPSCCASSTQYSGAGASTFATACPRRPLATSTSTPGTGWSGGSANDTTERNGTPSSAATFPGGGRSRTAWCCSNPKRCRSAATATGLTTSPHPGRQEHRQTSYSSKTWARGEPDAWRRARPVRRAG